LQEISPLPEKERPAAGRGRAARKMPHHLTSPEGLRLIKEGDNKQKAKQVKLLENKACTDRALKKKAQGDRMRRAAERAGDPMRQKQSTLEIVRKVYGDEVAKDVEAGAPIPGSTTSKPKPKAPPKKKVTERQTTKRKPSAMPRAPKLRRT